jgi:two-component system, OmpR family, response regulator
MVTKMLPGQPQGGCYIFVARQLEIEMAGSPASVPCDVLVVDDDILLGDTIARALTRVGLEVRTAHSGSSALHVIGSSRPRVIVLDYRLPDMTGLQLAQALQQHLPDISIVLMSGMVDYIDRPTLEKAGIKVFITKPVPLAPLRQAVVKLLREAA